MIEIKPLIEITDFLSYIYVSKNQRTSQGFTQSIITAQTGYLRNILTPKLYSSLLDFFSIEKKIIETNQIASTTQITLSDISGISVGDSFVFFDLPTTNEDDIGNILHNGERYIVEDLTVNSIIIAVDTTNTNNVVNQGTISKFLSPENEILYREIVPYLVFQSYLLYIPSSYIRDTPSGVKLKNNTFSENVEGELMGNLSKSLNNAMEVYKENLINFLFENHTLYNWETTKSKAEEIASTVLPLKNKPRFFRRGRILS